MQVRAFPHFRGHNILNQGTREGILCMMQDRTPIIEMRLWFDQSTEKIVAASANGCASFLDPLGLILRGKLILRLA